jgi:hypothetical protein
MIGINPLTQYQLTIIFWYLFNTYKKLINKYRLNNDILRNSYYILKYDQIHDLYVFEYVFNIKINVYINNKENTIFIYIYFNNQQKSKLVIKDNKIINNEQHKIILNIDYLDNYNIFNKLIVYNCGMVVHKNILINHFYNYKGIKRNQIN